MGYSRRRRLVPRKFDFVKKARGRVYGAYAPKRKYGAGRAASRPAALRKGPRTQRFKRKKSTLVGMISKVSDNSSKSSCSLGSKRSTIPHKIRNEPRRTRFLNLTDVITSPFGRQQVNSFVSVSRAQLADMATDFSGALTAGRKIFFEYMKHRLTFKNQSNLYGKVVIYDIMSSSRQCHSSTTDTPLEAWEKGVTDLGVPTGHLIPGQTPFKSPEFNLFFKIKKVTTVPMEPGQEHEHTVYQRINRTIDSTLFDDSTVTGVPLLTSFVMLVFYGSIVHDSTTPAVVSCGQIKLDIIQSHEFVARRAVMLSVPSVLLVNALPLVVTDPDHMGEADDQDVNNVLA